MTAALMSFLSGWWVRLFSRAGLPRDPARANRPPEITRDHFLPVPVDPVPMRSEQGGADSLKETVGLAHLPVPSVARPMADAKVRERTIAALDELRQIPALQSLAQGFMQTMSRPDVAVEEIVAALEKDSALCVRILRLANSVAVASESRIDDLATAVQMLGVRRVRRAAQALFTLRDAHRVAEGFDWRHLWIHALATAAIAEELERRLRPGAETQLHLAALMHDVGKIVLSTIAPDEYRGVLVAAWHEQGRLEDLERECLGVDHREAGLRFARHNQLSEVVIEAIAHHDNAAAAEKCRFEVALVALANYLSKAHGLGFSGSRIGADEAEFEQHPAWRVVTEESGQPPDAAALEEEIQPFLAELRSELRELRESA
ncbi:MAG: HDOD domain-containing protein [Verrucomicrobia bacterium]|nr:HDOD domain-containing protein [Verrucomicrobiota bacterium]